MQIDRRTMMEAAAAGALGLGLATQVRAAQGAIPSTAQPGGGDFAFLAGEWKIANRRKKDGGWDEFAGESTVQSYLGGLVSIEELRIPARNFFGMGVRAWRPKDKQWADHWTSAGNGVVNDPVLGRFVDGVGLFLSEEKDGGTTVTYRSMWDRITPTSCRWTQASSRDGGKSWDYDWMMDWTRA